jgi:hypothetical protein
MKLRKLCTYEVYVNKQLIGWRKKKDQAIQFASALLRQYDSVEIKRRARRPNDFDY